LWLHSLKFAQLLRSAACLHTNQSCSYLNHLVICFYPGLKRLEGEADHSHPFGAQVNNEFSYTSTPYYFVLCTGAPLLTPFNFLSIPIADSDECAMQLNRLSTNVLKRQPFRSTSLVSSTQHHAHNAVLISILRVLYGQGPSNRAYECHYLIWLQKLVHL